MLRPPTPTALASLVFALLVAVASAPAEELRVPEAYPSIQEAIDAASNGDVVLVEPGVYQETIRFLGKAIVVQSRSGPGATVLDGGGSGSVVRFDGLESYDSVLQGFTLTGGIGSPIGTTRFGGGILCDGSSPTLLDNIVTGNSADIGGGIACFGSAHPRISGGEVAANEAILDGGGIACDEDSCPEISAVTVGDNLAGRRGGGLLVSDSAPLIVDSVILRNRSLNGGGGISCERHAFLALFGTSLRENVSQGDGGGGIACSISEVLLGNCEIVDNAVVSNADGGGVYLFASAGTIANTGISGNTCGHNGGGVFAWYASTLELDGCEIVGNRAGFGGGGVGYEERSGGRVEECRIAWNEAEVWAGGLLCSALSDPRVGRNEITGNIAQYGGGALVSESSPAFESNVFCGNLAELEGGGLSILYESLMLLHQATFAGNEAGEAGGAVFVSRSRPEIVGSILWQNAAPFDRAIALRLGATVDVRYSVVDGGWPGVGNFEADPLFVDCDSGDLRLRLGSPCADAGDPGLAFDVAQDVEGDDRVLDGDLDGVAAVDIGADEIEPGTAVRFGGINGGTGPLVAVLRINGTAGDRSRVVRLSRTDPVECTVEAPPAGPVPAPFVLYLWFGEPDIWTLALQPRGLGWAAFPTPLAGDPASGPARIWNNLGYPARLGEADLPSDPAPSVLFRAPQGIGIPLQFTLQGIQQDLGSSTALGVSLTNALVVQIEE